MPSTRLAIAEIESWTPAIDARAVENGSLFVLEGKNFLFDAKGPKSGFGSILVSDESLDDSIEQIESITIAGRTVVLTGNGAYELRRLLANDTDVETFPGSGESWFKLASWEMQKSYDVGKYGWTFAYVGFGAFLNHPGYGLFKLLGDRMEIFPQTGVDEDILAIAESAGRLVLITRTLTQFSNADDAKDMSPDLGGAGFQITRQRVPGLPLAITSFQGGFIVWTTAGVLAAEFVGGDTVFRFDRVITEQFMISAKAWEPLASGDHVVMTKQGLFLSSATNGLQPYSDVFNEFLRTMMSDSDNFVFRLTFIKEDDLLFLQIADGTLNFNRTFVYHQATKKWGEFSETHRGIIRFSAKAGDYGYADVDGFIHHFNGSAYRETQSRELTGLDSYISLGYIRPANGAENADVQFEMQEIIIGARETRTGVYSVTEVDWDGEDAFKSYNIGFYLSDEDWSQFGVDFYDVDWSFPGASEDWSLPGAGEDWNDPVAGQRDFDWSQAGQLDEDWSLTPPDGVSTDYLEDFDDGMFVIDSEEDWDGVDMFFNNVEYSIDVQSNLDGWEEELRVVPNLAIAKPKTDMWTLFSHGARQRINLYATQPWEKFHVTTLEISLSYSGQLS